MYLHPLFAIDNYVVVPHLSAAWIVLDNQYSQYSPPTKQNTNIKFLDAMNMFNARRVLLYITLKQNIFM